ncbi:hypothetical protein A2608_02255 [Candidatus Azambacteria bacterium RIFOXYD1_FULL_44_10]|uniref:CxxC-x17-CxxC domain-containing protein n=1 Tax=Candidatus Azambacteria bacterium RIFCSPLOWO2_02_FULL_44_14 TaxID=1797306 RepID=A0A1F5C9X7_9BACT|nr:MAG: hypothetical protein A3I30_04125 [Candidatus Azambacteria bacterium RIFCSPLOWO2_02_FULL_44_14]OGD51936.1 MAG: hypothetical protein A2608_02255 [Candidatus Azambacteria bacterium RIFOXYD1_FULL_44_10]
MFQRDNDDRGYQKPREEYTGKWICSGCQADTPHSLPFTPNDPDRPVYCKNCYLSKKQAGK